MTEGAFDLLTVERYPLEWHVLGHELKMTVLRNLYTVPGSPEAIALLRSLLRSVECVVEASKLAGMLRSVTCIPPCEPLSAWSSPRDLCPLLAPSTR